MSNSSSYICQFCAQKILCRNTYTVVQGVSKKGRTFSTKTLLMYLQLYKCLPFQSIPLLAMYHSHCFFKFWNNSWNTLLKWCAAVLQYFTSSPLLIQNDVLSSSPSVLGTRNSLLWLSLESRVYREEQLFFTR